MVRRYSEIGIAFIYGSYAKGKEKAASDIDLIVVGNPERKALTSDIRKLEDKLNREINFTLYAPEEFEAKRRQKGGFLAQVVKGKVILLKGDFNAGNGTPSRSTRFDLNPAQLKGVPKVSSQKAFVPVPDKRYIYWRFNGGLSVEKKKSL